jgi:hypothetical protein
MRKLFHFLTAIDEDLAARRRSLGCSLCGGVLHSAVYLSMFMNLDGEMSHSDHVR